MSSSNTGRTGRGSRRPPNEPAPTPTNNPANTTTTTTITNDILLHRLETGLAIAGGGRGSLTRLLSTANTSTIVDWQLQQLEMTKLILIVQRQEQEIIEQQQQLQQAEEEETTNTSAKSLDELRHELVNLQHLQVCLDEYEAMSKLVYKQKQTSISEFELKQELDKLNFDINTTKTDLRHVETACRIRNSQFQLLQTSLQDFKDSLSHQQPLILEPHEIVAHEQDEAEMRMKEEENKEVIEEETKKKKKATTSSHDRKQKDDDDDDDDDVVMEDVVDADDERKDDDNANNNDGDNDDDGDLYGDL